MNTVIVKLGLAVVLAMVISAPALAQTPNWSHPGGSYAPGKGTVQQPTARQTKKFDQGDNYARGQTKKLELGGYYPKDSPFGGENHCCISTPNWQ